MMPHEFENAIYTLRTQSTSQHSPNHQMTSPTSTYRDEETKRSPLSQPPDLNPSFRNEEETRMYIDLSEAVISPPEHIYECPI